MQSNHLGRPIAAFAAIFLLSACSPFGGVSLTASAAGIGAVNASSGTLLYVANLQPTTGVDILTLPGGMLVATITGIGYPRGVCADGSGPCGSRRIFMGTPLHCMSSPAAQRRRCTRFSGRRSLTAARSIRAATSWCSPQTPSRARWKCGRHRSKVSLVIDLPVDPLSAAFDARGNLYIKGFSGSDPVFGELPKGSKKMTFLEMRHGGYFASNCVGWDGTYVTIGANTREGGIYRLAIAGKTRESCLDRPVTRFGTMYAIRDHR